MVEILFARKSDLDDVTSAWTPYTPVVTAASGTFTTVTATGRYKKIGRTVFVTANLVVTTVGTATGAARMSLPVASSNAIAFIGVGRENALTGNAFTCFLSDANTLQMVTYNNTFGLSNGSQLAVSFVYESAA